MEAQSATAPSPIPKQYTLEEYFDLEYKASGKQEFWDGQIRAMSYTSPKHGDIA